MLRAVVPHRERVKVGLLLFLDPGIEPLAHPNVLIQVADGQRIRPKKLVDTVDLSASARVWPQAFLEMPLYSVIEKAACGADLPRRWAPSVDLGSEVENDIAGTHPCLLPNPLLSPKAF